MIFPTLVPPLFAVTLVSGNDVISRVYNGEERVDLKFLVRIEMFFSSGNYFCSGSIINKHWIITAAHCVSYPGQLLQARVTHYRILRFSPFLSISDFFRHPNFIPDTNGTRVLTVSVNFDLALLQTTQPIRFYTLVQPISLARHSPQPGPAVVAGYGEPTYLPRKAQITLSYCPVPNMKPILCSLTRANMPHTGKGDSGGPVVANGVLVGVVSSGNDECIIEDRFADIASNYDWIQSVIN